MNSVDYTDCYSMKPWITNSLPGKWPSLEVQWWSTFRCLLELYQYLRILCRIVTILAAFAGFYGVLMLRVNLQCNFRPNKSSVNVVVRNKRF